MAIRLFESALSSYTRKVKLGLYEKGIPFEPVAIDPGGLGAELVHQDFVLASPRREVPALVDGELRLVGSRPILDYLDERWPGSPLLPEAAAERARVRMLEEELDSDYDAAAWAFRSLPELPAERREALRAALLARFAELWHRLERQLAGREWMNGGRFGRADLVAYAHVSATEQAGLESSRPGSVLADWLARCRARECVRREERELTRARAAAEPRPAPSPDLRGHRLQWAIAALGAQFVERQIAEGRWRLPSSLDRGPREEPAGRRSGIE